MNLEPESLWLIENARIPLDGCYVDLGCAHPNNVSLTSFARQSGLRGLAIDANLDYANDWAAAGFGSHFVCALLSDQPHARFVTHENSFTSRISEFPENDEPDKWGIKRIEDRSTVPLNHLLDVHGIGHIDLLTIDLEGHEFAVLSTLDFEKHSPDWIVSEYVTQGDGTDPRLCQMLLSKGYRVAHMTESNLIFQRL